MALFDFVDYIEVEIESMKRFHKEESERQGRELTEHEATMLWVTSGKAVEFREEYEREHDIDG